MSLHTQIAWWVVLACVIFSARIATTFLRQNPRLFTVMALFACSWALLLPYYGVAQNAESLEILGAFSGFLSVYIGGLLMLQAQHEQAHHDQIVPLQVIGLLLLLVIAAPSTPQISTPGGTIFGISSRQADMVVGTLLDVAGFVAIGWGVHKLGYKKVFWLLVVILVPYALVEIAFTVRSWPESAAKEDFPATYAYFFALIKALFTLTFGFTIADEGMPPREREAGAIHWITCLIGITSVRT